MKSRFRIRTAACAVVAMAAVALSGPALALDKVKVALLMIGNPLIVGNEKGFFAEYGVEVEPVYMRSGSEQIPAISTRTVDVMLSSASAAMFNAFASGIDMKIVADNISLVPGTMPNALLVRKALADSGDVKSVADLKGRSMAITAIGVYTHQTAIRLLNTAGLSEKDVRLVSMPYPDMLAGLSNGAIDSAQMTEPFITQAIEMGVARLLVDHTRAFPNMQLAVTVFGPRLLRENPDLGVRFMRGLLKSMRYMRESLTDPAKKAEISAMMQKHLPGKDPGMYQRMSWQLSVEGQRVNVPSLQDQIDFYASQKLVPKAPNLADHIDMSFLERADAR